jgi:type II secretory pathway predicted ATPase ExeA
MMPGLMRRLRLPAPTAVAPVPRGPAAAAWDQRPFFPSRSHVAVLDEVRRALKQREGLVVITGAPGTGKTLLCRTLLQELGPGVCASVVLDPRVTIDDLLLHVLTDFGVISSPRQVAAAGAPTRHQLMRALQHFLASLVPVWGCAVLVIDDAQNLDAEVFEQLRVLLNFETDEAKLLQIVLVGQPALDERLREPALRPLEARVARRCHLEPLAPAEVAPYIDHRLGAGQGLSSLGDMIVLDAGALDAGSPRPNVTFTPSAVRVLARRSRGIPRAVNALCDRAVEIAAERGVARVDWRIALAATRRIRTRAYGTVRFRMATRMAMAAAAVTLLAVIGFGVRSWGASTLPAASPPPPFAHLDPQVMLSRSLAVSALAGVESYNIKVASFRVMSNADALVEQLQSAGLPAFTAVERAGVNAVIVGPYLSHRELASVQARLAGFGYREGAMFVEAFEPLDGRAGLLARSQGLGR